MTKLSIAEIIALDILEEHKSERLCELSQKKLDTYTDAAHDDYDQGELTYKVGYPPKKGLEKMKKRAKGMDLAQSKVGKKLANKDPEIRSYLTDPKYLGGVKFSKPKVAAT